MTFTIPVWVMWAIGFIVGIPALVFILFCAWFGYAFLKGIIENGGFYK